MNALTRIFSKYFSKSDAIKVNELVGNSGGGGGDSESEKFILAITFNQSGGPVTVSKYSEILDAVKSHKLFCITTPGAREDIITYFIVLMVLYYGQNAQEQSGRIDLLIRTAGSDNGIKIMEGDSDEAVITFVES